LGKDGLQVVGVCDPLPSAHTCHLSECHRSHVIRIQFNRLSTTCTGISRTDANAPASAPVWATIASASLLKVSGCAQIRVPLTRIDGIDRNVRVKDTLQCGPLGGLTSVGIQ